MRYETLLLPYHEQICLYDVKLKLTPTASQCIKTEKIWDMKRCSPHTTNKFNYMMSNPSMDHSSAVHVDRRKRWHQIGCSYPTTNKSNSIMSNPILNQSSTVLVIRRKNEIRHDAHTIRKTNLISWHQIPAWTTAVQWL